MTTTETAASEPGNRNQNRRPRTMASALERAAHQWRLHQTDHLLYGTPWGQPLTCDLNCPMRAFDDDDDK